MPEWLTVKAILRNLALVVRRPASSWLTLLLLLVVLAPSICLIWFVRQTVQNERFALRQKLADAYRGHLSLAQERLNNYLRQVAGDADVQTTISAAPALFARLVRAERADAVVCFDRAGNVVYPDTPALPAQETLVPGWIEAENLASSKPASGATAFGQLAETATNTNLAARALLAQARCFLRATNTEAAVTVLTRSLEQQRFRHATDAQGRLLVPNAELLAFETLQTSQPEQATEVLKRLEARLADYEDPALSAAQRRFLMHQIERDTRASFPTSEAEDLAARLVEAGPVHPGDAVLRPTSLPGVWQLSSTNRLILTLHRTENLTARLQAAVANPALPADVSLAVLTPGTEAEGFLASLPAGESLPGWRLALSLKDQRLFDATADQRVAAYMWIGGLVVAAVAVLGALAMRLVRRQIALTQLRNDLVANVTHELKTPLSSMRLLVETLLDSPTLNERTAREYLQLIATENARLSRLIDNFLTFSRMERKKYAFGFRSVAPKAIVDAAAAAMRERFSSPGCHFSAQLPDDLPPVMADADAMVTVLVNLLDNAYKYSGDEKEISLTAGRQNGSVVFAVKDNGIGLSARETRKVFKRFYQVDQRMSHTTGGCGLGLSIVKFVVTAHRGDVWVESQPGRGSTFFVTLPSAEGEDALVSATKEHKGNKL